MVELNDPCLSTNRGSIRVKKMASSIMVRTFVLHSVRTFGPVWTMFRTHLGMVSRATQSVAMHTLANGTRSI